MRAPFQVLIFPYRERDLKIEILIGKRKDNKIWQGIAGGGEGSESPLEAAKRELREETGLYGAHWKKLDAMCTVPKNIFKGHELWKAHKYVIPEYAFMVEATGQEALSAEHSELRWCREETALAKLTFDSNKTAVWELFQRLKQSS